MRSAQAAEFVYRFSAIATWCFSQDSAGTRLRLLSAPINEPLVRTKDGCQAFRRVSPASGPTLDHQGANDHPEQPGT